MTRLSIVVAGVLAVCASPWLASAGTPSAPSRQDILILGRILSFREASFPGAVTIAVVYDATDPQSQGEAQSLADLMGTGVVVGGLTLRPALVEQSRLAGTSGLGAIFTTASVSPAVVQSVLRQQRIPCVTRHIEQVTQGSCIVSIRSSPTVSIAYSSANAAAAGVRFATAFIMMVREI